MQVTTIILGTIFLILVGLGTACLIKAMIKYLTEKDRK